MLFLRAALLIFAFVSHSAVAALDPEQCSIVHGVWEWEEPDSTFVYHPKLRTFDLDPNGRGFPIYENSTGTFQLFPNSIEAELLAPNSVRWLSHHGSRQDWRLDNTPGNVTFQQVYYAPIFGKAKFRFYWAPVQGSYCRALTLTHCESASITINGMQPWGNGYCRTGGYLAIRKDPHQIVVTAGDSIIPTDARVSSRKVLTKSKLTLAITNQVDGGFAHASFGAVQLSSNRGTPPDTFGEYETTSETPEPTAITTSVETRDQSSPTILSLATNTYSPDLVGELDLPEINWLPARYEPPFLVTCYVLSQEASFSETPTRTNVPGLPKENVYRSKFLRDVVMQGSGIALDGTIVRYDAHRRSYSISRCPLTASGQCAVDGSTAAVNFAVNPIRSTFDIDGDGQWKALDTGDPNRFGGDNFHIDEYMGTRRSECLALGNRSLGVTMVSY